MKEQKNLIMTAMIYAILIGVYNFLVFVIFKEYTTVFWISYGFAMAAFALQITAMRLSFKKANVETVFFGLPLASFSVFYLIAVLAVSTIFMIFHSVNMMIPLVLHVLILAGFLVVAIVTLMARDAVQAIGDNVKQKVVQHKIATVDIEVLHASCSNPELKAKLRKLSETIKYSDPMTNEAIADVEQWISHRVGELRYYCENGAIDEAVKTCAALELLYIERNKKLMLTK